MVLCNHLTDLLILATNKLDGTIPTTIGNLSRLKELSIMENHLSGGLPSELGQLTQLESLGIGYNHFTGVIPEELCILRMERNVTIRNPRPDPVNGLPDDLCDNSLFGGVQCPYLECCPSCPQIVIDEVPNGRNL